VKIHDLDPDDQDVDAAALRELIRQAEALGPLKAVEERQLLERAAVGDQASHDRLFAAHLPLVMRLAAARGGRGLPVPDLVQEGSIGLVEAVRQFAESTETDFIPFAEARIAAQMDAALEAETAAVRDAELLVAAATDYEKAELVVGRLLHREPKPAELAEKLEWTVDRTLYVAKVVADARKRHDEELLAFIDPDVIDIDDDERADIDD